MSSKMMRPDSTVSNKPREFNAPLFLTAQALHNEIKGKKEKVEDVQKDADTCASSIKVSVKHIFKHFSKHDCVGGNRVVTY